VQIALTFDNLGEAADLERGLWPAAARVGRHPSVTEALPWLLDELDARSLRATFCVEALNCELYPAAVAEIAARGHEVAMHGVRHEAWSTLDAAREDALLARGRAAFAALELDVRGFRPPGGALGARGGAPLVEHGFRWCSPEGARRGRDGALAVVPFAWPLVDAYHRLDSFTARRGGASLGPEATADALVAALDATPEPTVILHPFLMLGDDARAAAQRVLAHVADLAAAGAARVAPAGEIAAAL
jgi:peptidoglycan/xylan/chitin deacetylase (PgdA/CDA1 family)